LITASPQRAMPHHRRAQGQAPTAAQLLAPHATVSMKTLLSDNPVPALLAPACPPRSHHNSLFTLQSTPAAVARGVVAQSSPSVAQAPAFGASRRSRAAPVARRTAGSPVVPLKAWLCRWWR
jgi:hypothetical protein